MPAILSPKISPRRLAGSLIWSLATAVSPLARDAEVRALCRRIVGPHEGCSGRTIGTIWTRRRLRAALGAWRWPTLPGTHRAVALALAERRVRPRLTAVA